MTGVLVTFRHIIHCSLQTKINKEMRSVAEKPHDAVVKFDTYRNVQRHRAVLLAIARHLESEAFDAHGTPLPFNNVSFSLA